MNDKARRSTTPTGCSDTEAKEAIDLLKSQPDLDRYLTQETLERANNGDTEAAQLALKWAREDLKQLDTPALKWLAENLDQIAQGVPADRALGIEAEPKKGGPGYAVDPRKATALYLLLRDHHDQTNASAIEFVCGLLDIDDRTLRGYRAKFDSRYNDSPTPLMNGLPERVLIRIAAEYLAKLAEQSPEVFRDPHPQDSP